MIHAVILVVIHVMRFVRRLLIVLCSHLDEDDIGLVAHEVDGKHVGRAWNLLFPHVAAGFQQK